MTALVPAVGFATERRTEFDRTTDVTPTDRPGTFTVDLSPRWSSLVGVHGGYLTAIAATAATRTVTDRAVRTVTTSFVRPTELGAAEVSVRELRRGRSVSTVQVDVTQGGRLALTSRITMVAEVAGVDWSTPEPLQVPPPGECVALEPPDHVEHFGRAEALIDPASLPFTGGARAVVRGHLRPLDDRPVDAAWLAMASDWFPPPAFVRIDPPVGGISIDLVTHVHCELPPLGEDWLAVSFEADTSTNGVATERGRIATSDGRLVAESLHTRWTATS